MLYSQMRSKKYVPADDEIVLHIQFDTKDDISLLVYDYRVDDHEYSGGISNADKSLIKHDSSWYGVGRVLVLPLMRWNFPYNAES